MARTPAIKRRRQVPLVTLFSTFFGHAPSLRPSQPLPLQRVKFTGHRCPSAKINAPTFYAILCQSFVRSPARPALPTAVSFVGATRR
ncbi:hypothetical protein L596_025397 [Steinernema carpocapsae]|uniref:Uncharacterized protein n=1 Tax=Steinernema carpocapsae TaxID=34508 RepID=A0A4V5ZYT1_STECR|nr:hypothetical protein L596_025397 [Steinernema carpocapsae]